jgi:hypothetical protein
MHYSHEHYATLLRITSTFFNVTSYLTYSNRSYIFYPIDQRFVCLCSGVFPNGINYGYTQWRS